MKKPALFLAAATVAIAVGCGGSTKDSNSNGGSGASGGTAGRGGSAGSGAGVGAGGGGASGSSGSAGSAGDAGVGGTGGSADGGVVPTDCNAPPESYGCEGGDNSFYFDSAAGVCKPYGAYRCSYNKANRFSSLAKCVATCPGARPDVTACDHGSECFIVDSGCCAACEPVQDRLAHRRQLRAHERFQAPLPAHRLRRLSARGRARNHAPVLRGHVSLWKLRHVRYQEHRLHRMQRRRRLRPPRRRPMLRRLRRYGTWSR